MTDKRLQVKLYDKRDDFNFIIVNFRFLSSNIPQSPVYGVYVSQLIRYARASSAYSDFLVRSRLLTRQLLGQGYNRLSLLLLLRSFVAVIIGRGPVGPTMQPPGQIFMGAKLFPRVYRIRRIFVSMNKLIPTICNLTVSMATLFF